MNSSENVFVVYNRSGMPLVYVIPVNQELTAEQMTAIQELFNGDCNAECILKWKEIF